MGDVYVMFAVNPVKGMEGWNPHSSYHASGQSHQKSFNRKHVVRHGQKPNLLFSGTTNLMTTIISWDHAKKMNVLCKPELFNYVIKIDGTDLNNNTYVSIDLADAKGNPIVTPGSHILQSFTVGDDVPVVLVTLFEVTPFDS